MNPIQIFHILIAFGALQALFLAIILLSRKKNISTRLFALFLLIEGFTLFERLLAETNLMTEIPHLLGISYPLNFIKPPILYFLALSIINNRFQLKWKLLPHAIPFFLMLLMNIPFYLMSGNEKVENVSAFVDYVPEYGSFNFWFFLSFFVYIGVYLGLSIRVIRNYKENFKSNRMANWYLNVVYLYSFLLSIMLLHFLLRPSGMVEFTWVNEASMLLMTFLIQSIAYSFLTKSSLLEQSNGKYPINIDQLSKDREQIKAKLEKEKVYLDDTLNLEDFAASLGLNKKHVSEVINQNFGTTFKNLINQYRVEHAKNLMSENIGSEVQLIQLGLRSGFNNKVSFYRVFKKQTGQSPTEYFQSLSK